MATYAIGDVQGCFTTLQALLGAIGFSRDRDRLWFVGDLVNRGADSLATLRFVQDLDQRAVCVMGNHDLHLLACAEGLATPRRHDTLDEILKAPDRDRLLEWLRRRPLLHQAGRFTMVHAGIAPGWDTATALQEAADVERRLQGADYRHLLAHMYGNQPDRFSTRLAGDDRTRFAINAFTRLRVVDDDGRVDLAFKGEPAAIPRGLRPWFAALEPTWRDRTIIAGHWSALGVRIEPGLALLDSGCVWGRTLSAWCLDDGRLHSVPCQEASIPEGWD